ncbi:PadR family transcriptional regulator [Agromyces salentinus]|uniref:Transcription regulator PadR N-terminal domain-containing protein n=1 Tax=Agromyces salentinus TaxID=269421 RepID=A0ABP4Z397_9MICO|nr:helix-turn-helix transcriptional regulator [Agromyces salentinus]
MAVRDSLLVLLTMGPAYGFALHGGLAERTGGRRSVNVGQTYATLDRLTKQGLIEPAGNTADGLPLHRLTAAGRTASARWLDGADAAGADPWDETVDRVLIASSLPRFDATTVIDAELARWTARRDDSAIRADAAHAADAPPARLAVLGAAAEMARAESAINWLEGARRASGLGFEPSTERPRRGRRPGGSAGPAASADLIAQGSTAP